MLPWGVFGLAYAMLVGAVIGFGAVLVAGEVDLLGAGEFLVLGAVLVFVRLASLGYVVYIMVLAMMVFVVRRLTSWPW